MKYNENDIVLIHYKTVNGTTKEVGIIKEKHNCGIIDGKDKYNYLVLMCGTTTPLWVRGEEVKEKLYEYPV